MRLKDLFSSTHTYMKNFFSTIGMSKTFFAALVILLLVGLMGRYALASTPTVEERAAAKLPSVVAEINDTQEAADRNAKAKLCKQVILACEQGDCTAFAANENCDAF